MFSHQKFFWECCKWNPRQLDVEASMLTTVLCYPIIFFKDGPFPASFSLFSLLWIAIDRYMFENFHYQCWDLNRGSLVSETTALPAVPQPRPSPHCLNFSVCYDTYKLWFDQPKFVFCWAKINSQCWLYFFFFAGSTRDPTWNALRWFTRLSSAVIRKISHSKTKLFSKLLRKTSNFEVEAS